MSENVYPRFDPSKLTLHCTDCDREMTAAEWPVYFGRMQGIVPDSGTTIRWRCGCVGERGVTLHSTDAIPGLSWFEI